MLTEEQIEEWIEELENNYIQIENSNLWIEQVEKRKMLITIKINTLKEVLEEE